ncbi:MAG: hypothetical protein SGPRY_013617, partial [Prymnesium sp.]
MYHLRHAERVPWLKELSQLPEEAAEAIWRGMSSAADGVNSALQVTANTAQEMPHAVADGSRIAASNVAYAGSVGMMYVNQAGSSIAEKSKTTAEQASKASVAAAEKTAVATKNAAQAALHTLDNIEPSQLRLSMPNVKLQNPFHKRANPFKK